jgi:E3 ubiquitin-protein ligase UBR7
MSEENFEMAVDNEIFSLQDVIDQEKEIKDMADAVLGASDHVNCSYDQGYVYRQALYSCLTCLRENNVDVNKEDYKLSGICLACSYECHQNHQLVELYTKRDFRCDCGNQNFAQTDKKFTCKLQPHKDSINTENKYNHNFLGLYCSCNTPYAEESIHASVSNTNEHSMNQEEDAEMIQCTLCEDWYHLNHLSGADKFDLPETNDDFELVCESCMSDNQFLWLYQKYMPIRKENATEEAFEVTESQNCMLGELEPGLILTNKQDLVEKKQACFFSPGWRRSLCQCISCSNLYRERHVEFLFRNNDTIDFYENLGKEKAEQESLNENKLLNEQLGKLDRVSQIDFLSDLNEFKQELSEFLAGFAKLGEVVKQEDILGFFEKLNKRKKQRATSSSSLNYSCK